MKNHKRTWVSFRGSTVPKRRVPSWRRHRRREPERVPSRSDRRALARGDSAASCRDPTTRTSASRGAKLVTRGCQKTLGSDSIRGRSSPLKVTRHDGRVGDKHARGQKRQKLNLMILRDSPPSQAVPLRRAIFMTSPSASF